MFRIGAKTHMRNTIILAFLFLSTFVQAQEEMKFESAIVDQSHFDFHIISPSDTLSVVTILKNGEVVLTDSLSVEITRSHYEDFNQDGHLDFYIYFTSIWNTEWRTLYLYDDSSKTYKRIVDFQYFFEAKPVPEQSGYYYSYNDIRCNGAKWNSELFVIRDFEVNKLARISANQCVHSTQRQLEVEVPNGQYRYKLIEKFPYDTLDKTKGYKWRFMENYWIVNAQKFLKP